MGLILFLNESIRKVVSGSFYQEDFGVSLKCLFFTYSLLLLQKLFLVGDWICGILFCNMYLTHKQLLSNVGSGTVVLKHQSISTYSVDKILIVLDQIHTNILH